jgi:hypothetical protein
MSRVCAGSNTRERAPRISQLVQCVFGERPGYAVPLRGRIDRNHVDLA